MERILREDLTVIIWFWSYLESFPLKYFPTFPAMCAPKLCPTTCTCSAVIFCPVMNADNMDPMRYPSARVSSRAVEYGFDEMFSQSAASMLYLFSIAYAFCTGVNACWWRLAFQPWIITFNGFRGLKCDDNWLLGAEMSTSSVALSKGNDVLWCYNLVQRHRALSYLA